MKITQAGHLRPFCGARHGKVTTQELTIMKSRSFCGVAVAIAALFFLGSLLTIGIGSRLIVAAPAEPTPRPPQGKTMAPSPIPDADLISAQDLAKILQSPQRERPLLIYVGFRLPYTQAHIPGSVFFGPAANQAVVQRLQKHVEALPRDRFVVVYCGCCPWSRCPNVKPAYEALHNLGFRKLKVLYIPDNLGTDWVNKGYPVEKGE
jgi:hypothetical protein